MHNGTDIYATKVCSRALRKKYQDGIIPVIPDIKRFSPKEGSLMRGRNPVDYALRMDEAGAPVISVVTEQEHYGGSLKLLEEVSESVMVPVLRKDFIRTKQQIKDSKEAGAAAVLLIASILDRKQLIDLIEFAYINGLEPLVEVHSYIEMHLVNELKLPLVGINNRNIMKYEVDYGDVVMTECLNNNFHKTREYAVIFVIFMVLFSYRISDIPGDVNGGLSYSNYAKEKVRTVYEDSDCIERAWGCTCLSRR